MLCLVSGTLRLRDGLKMNKIEKLRDIGPPFRISAAYDHFDALLNIAEASSEALDEIDKHKRLARSDTKIYRIRKALKAFKEIK